MQMFHRRSSALVLSLCLISCARAQAPAQPSTPTSAKAVPDFMFPAKAPFRFIAYGDVRFTDPADKDWSDAPSRQALVARITREKPKAVVFVGDLVKKGSVAADWDVVARETAPWREAGIRLLPIIGNHETWDDPQAVNYFRHFPELKGRHWYTARLGNCWFIMLESEPNRPGTEQWQWMEQQLRQVPPDVDYLFVVVHNPPYTRSRDDAKGGGHAARPEDQQLAALLEQRQPTLGRPIIVLAGHVHNYERYVHGGVTYIVTGGGGATPYEIPRQPDDLYRAPGPAYHFCRFTVGRNSLKVEMVKLQITQGKPQFKVADSFSLGRAKSQAASVSR